jgi:sodium-dependent dicarboxylate transporter 2/3/5
VKRKLFILLGPLLAVCMVLFVDLDPANRHVTLMAAIAVWMAIWWLAEPVHLAVTALVPFIFIPVLGIADVQTVANQYMDQVMFLFIGGFLLAFAIERWGLHRRISLRILSAVGKSPASILLGVMLTAWLLSMWISNTATVMMLLGAVLAIVKQLDSHIPDEKQRGMAASAVLIGLAYAATIGGMATLVGTPPNMVFYRTYIDAYPQNGDMSFNTWFAFAVPLSAVFIAIAWLVIRFSLLRHTAKIKFDRKLFGQMRKELGPMHTDEKVVLLIFLSTILLWFTRAGFQFWDLKIPGWTALLGEYGKYIQDSTVAIAMALLLFLIPSRTEKDRSLLSWSEARELPFDIILLFGSGFALAKGFELSGLSNWLAGRLELLQDAPIWLLVLVVAAVVTLISEFASNIASIQLALPVLISMQKVLDVHPLVLLIPATLAASLGFMLPVATAPNTIVFGTGRIKVSQMVRTGFVLDLAGIGLIVVLSLVWMAVEQ